jgi:glutamate-1-semialdehyde 2,1-aminomutase
MDHTEKLFSNRLHHVIPGGAHTYSRGDDQFPSNAPAILERGEGAFVYDPAGVKYLDYGMGLRSINIGYGNLEIAEAVFEATLKGNNLTRASLIELEAAELFVSTIPSVDMVKFAKHGSTVTTAAMKLARAYTSKKYIAVPFEQPFFSFDDWFIGTTVIEKGTLSETSRFTLKFHYNDIASLNALFEKYPNQIAGVMLEPATTLSPCKTVCSKSDNEICACKNGNLNFLHQVKEVCTKNEAVFILDEMITGFRWNFNGAQTFFNIEPDLTTFGKAIANGFAVAALGGKREIMSLGGIQESGAERIFLTSTTHGAEMSALAAYIKTSEIIQREDMIAHVWQYGKALVGGMNEIARDLGIENYFSVEGYHCSPNYNTRDQHHQPSLEMRTLFAQEMIKNKVMMPYIALSLSHGPSELDQTLSAVRESLSVYKQALESGVSAYLDSDIIKPVFRKYN